MIGENRVDVRKNRAIQYSEVELQGRKEGELVVGIAEMCSLATWKDGNMEGEFIHTSLLWCKLLVQNNWLVLMMCHISAQTLTCHLPFLAVLASLTN